MKKNNFIKLNILSVVSLIFIAVIVMPIFSMWATNENGIFWVEPNFTIAVDGWKLIDDDNDGIGYYYYFDENGYIVVDDITPDYKIIGKDGRRLGFDGKPVAEVIDKLNEEYIEQGIYSAEILAQIKADQGIQKDPVGHTSSGVHLYVKDNTEIDGPKPSDNLVIDTNPDGTSKWILGPNVTLEKKKDNIHDPQMDKEMQSYITGGDKYSKKVNGTTFNKAKWKEVMALKGTGATIIFENPKNNFNKLKGRIATHYFTYSDRTTSCTLYIFSEDTGEELYSTSNFNYNGGTAFECTFPKKTNAIRFELEVSGQYTSRVCYLRNCQFGFDKDLYEEELYEDEIEAEFRRRVGTVSDADYQEVDEDENYGLGDIPVEGEDPGQRYRRIHGISEEEGLLGYDLEDEDLPEALRASISELRKRMADEDEARNAVSGPAFDPKLINETRALGPDGSRMIIPGKED